MFKYLDWIETQTSDDYTMTRIDEDNIEIKTKCVTGSVGVYHLEEEIVSLSVIRNKDEENIFFLHFELKDEDHAKQLFTEMIDVIVHEGKKTTLQVLLSCTSGLTTSFFADQLNNAANTLSLDYEFSAVSFSDIYEKAFSKDVILLAPQIAYEYDKLKDILHDKIVLKIPGQVFASYNTGEVIDMIKDAITEAETTKEEKAIAKVMRDIENNARIMTITLMHDPGETLYNYRVYDKGQIVEQQRVIKRYKTLLDLQDILDVELPRYQEKYGKIDAVAISMPGVIEDVKDIKNERIQYQDIKNYLESLYHVPFYVSNNTNAVALGYYATQNEYDIVTYHSQPRGRMFAGQGIIYDGTLIEGAHFMGGELESICLNEYPDCKDNVSIFEMFEGKEAIERLKKMILKYLISNISVVDPQVILIRSDLTPDMEEFKKELEKVVYPSYVPKLIHVRDVSEYQCLGTMMLGLKGLQKDYKNKKA